MVPIAITWALLHELGQTPGDDEGKGSLACCSPWGCKESDVTGDWTTATILLLLVGMPGQVHICCVYTTCVGVSVSEQECEIRVCESVCIQEGVRGAVDSWVQKWILPSSGPILQLSPPPQTAWVLIFLTVTKRLHLLTHSFFYHIQ